MKTVAFTQMKDGTQEEYIYLQGLEHEYIRGLPDRLLVALKRLGDSMEGYQISRLTHSLQSSRRAAPLCARRSDVDRRDAWPFPDEVLRAPLRQKP